MRRIGWLAAVLSFSVAAGTPVTLTPAQQQAILDEGTAFGQGALSVGAGTINSAGGMANVPGYNTMPSGQSPGATRLSGAANAKKAECDGYAAPAGAGQVANQMDCDAVDFLTKHQNPKSAYQINPNTDPTIQAGRAVLNSVRSGAAFLPGGVADGFGVNGTTQQANCTTNTTVPPVTTIDQNCYTYASSDTQAGSTEIAHEYSPITSQSITTEICHRYTPTFNKTCDETLNVTVSQLPTVSATKVITGYGVWVGRVLSRGAYLGDCFIGGAYAGTAVWPSDDSNWQPDDIGVPGSPPTGALLRNVMCYDAYSWTCPSGYTQSELLCLPPPAGVSSTAYSCTSGAVLSGTNCVLYPAPTSATITVYSCPSGYTLSGTNCVTQPASFAATTNTTYSCPAGYTLSGTTCSTQELIVAPTSTTGYSCPAGSTLSGTSCIPAPEIISATGTTTYSCPAGSTLSGTSCVYPVQTQAATVTPIVGTYGVWTRAGPYWADCNTGGFVTHPDDDVQYCETTPTPQGTGSDIGIQGGDPACRCYDTYVANYSCPSGWALSGTTCSYQQATSSATGNTSYSCPSGYTLSGTSCVTQPASFAATAGTIYSCPSGYSYNGTNCIIPAVSVPATGNTIYSCPTGSTLSGTSCIPAPETIPATASDGLSCPIGATLVANSCVYPMTITPAIETTTKATISSSWADSCTPSSTPAGCTVSPVNWQPGLAAYGVGSTTGTPWQTINPTQQQAFSLAQSSRIARHIHITYAQCNLEFKISPTACDFATAPGDPCYNAGMGISIAAQTSDQPPLDGVCVLQQNQTYYLNVREVAGSEHNNCGYYLSW